MNSNWKQKKSDVGVWAHFCPTTKDVFKTWLSECPKCGKPAPEFPQIDLTPNVMRQVEEKP